MLLKTLILEAAAQTIQAGNLRINIWWWPFVFAFFKNMFIFIDILIFVAMVMLLYRFQSFTSSVYEAIAEGIASGKISQARAQRKWEEAKELMKSENIADRKKAIATLENILDNALKMADFSGENLEKRLAKIPENRMNFQDDIVWAFRLRKRMDENPEFAPDNEEVSRAFYIFERTLKEFGIL